MNTKINAASREDQGKGASRRLRHQEKVPAIVYGAVVSKKVTFL